MTSSKIVILPIAQDTTDERDFMLYMSRGKKEIIHEKFKNSYKKVSKSEEPPLGVAWYLPDENYILYKQKWCNS